MARASNSRILRMIPLLIAVCLFNFPTFAQYGDGGGTTGSARTNTYVFLPGQSTVVQTGGIAGVHETYPIQGQFQLKVDVNDTVALFGHVDAFLLSPVSSSPPLSLGELFNMPTLVGEVLDNTTISFTGKADNGSSVLITVTIEDDLVYLVGKTIPPPNSADFFLFSLDAVAQRKYSGGTGEPNDPYLIYTAEQMNEIGLNKGDWDKHFKLMADIDLSAYTGTDFNIIGYFVDWDDNKPFTGVFEGNGHKITNLNYTSTNSDNIGLFGYVEGSKAEIKDLVLIDPNIDAGSGSVVGSLVGFNGGAISNCHVQNGSVAGYSDVGGLAGGNSWFSQGARRLINCSATGKVSSTTSAGGLLGYNSGTITDSYSICSVSGSERVGGLVEYNFGTISKCYAGGSVSGDYVVGGLVAYNYDTVAECFSTAAVSGVSEVGGMMGINVGAITNCYSTSSVLGDSRVGGLVGCNAQMHAIVVPCQVVNCYSIGSVSGNTDVGGLVGAGNQWEFWVEVMFSFWDIEASGQQTSTGGTGKTTAEMQTAGTFLDAGWDFVDETENGTEDIWWIDEGQNYPRLWWEIPEN